MRLFVFFLVAFSCGAEFLKIEQTFGGIDCASCSDFVQKRLATNPGINTVAIDLKKGVLTVDLKPGNTVRLRQIRDLVQQSGFTPKEMKVTAIGKVMVDRGYTNFKVEGLEGLLRVKDNEGYLRELGNARAKVEGVIDSSVIEGTRIDFLIPTKGDRAPK